MSSLHRPWCRKLDWRQRSFRQFWWFLNHLLGAWCLSLKSKLYFVLVIDYLFWLCNVFWVCCMLDLSTAYGTHFGTPCVYMVYILKPCLTYLYHFKVNSTSSLVLCCLFLVLKRKKDIPLWDCIFDVVASHENQRFSLTILLVQNLGRYSLSSLSYW
jgi:hypothetical protein